jgi:hypothetical protein
MCEVTRSLRDGQTGPLPEGAAGWLVRSWGPDHSPAQRWAARDRLVRIEQLVAACREHGGRAKAHDDPLLAHLVVPHDQSMIDDDVIYVSVHDKDHNSWDTDVVAPMRVTRSRGGHSGSETLDELAQVTTTASHASSVSGPGSCHAASNRRREGQAVQKQG